MQDHSLGKLLFKQPIDKLFDLSSTFGGVKYFEPFLVENNNFLLKKIDEHFYNNSPFILLLEYSEYKEIEHKLSNYNSEKFFTILYDQKEESFNEELPDNVFDVITVCSKKKLAFILNKAFTTLKNKLELNVLTKELKVVNSIGISLSTERDINKLLDTILIKCMEITESDSGSMYIVEEKVGESEKENDYFSNKNLLFKLAKNNTLKVDFQESVLELSKSSIAGYVALTGKPLLIEDSYHLPNDSEFSHNKSFDESIGYRCKSMLIVPMKNQKDEIIGVIQLINKKRKFDIKLKSTEIVDKQVISYSENDQELIFSVASQAAILIDNTRLYYSIRNLFEGFIKASVTAIEARDPTTSGHSERVADLTVALAEKADSINEGKLKNVKFSRNDLYQIKYASLLHDFGKIGVREDVLVKAKKLYPFELNSIEQRFKYIKKSVELNFVKAKLDFVLKNPGNYSNHFAELEKNFEFKMAELNDYLQTILKSNEPSILEQETSKKLIDIRNSFFKDFDNSKINYLSDYELESLSILKGTLSNAERKEIESHVTHTYQFLANIPWTKEFKGVPDIAYSHHEKLDGTGYPRGINNEEIPIQSKMMTISDIYDALTASDRPYKKALPYQRAIDILGFEVKANKLDPDLYKLFVDAKIYEVISSE